MSVQLIHSQVTDVASITDGFKAAYAKYSKSGDVIETEQDLDNLIGLQHEVKDCVLLGYSSDFNLAIFDVQLSVARTYTPDDLEDDFI